jgi:hypothetical protein
MCTMLFCILRNPENFGTLFDGNVYYL